MFSIRKFVVYSTLLMIFSDRLYITVGINIFAYYFIIMLNLFLLWKVGSIWLPRGLLIFLGCLLLSSVIGMIQGTDSIGLASKELLGIAASSIYACSFYSFIKFDTESFFELYSHLSYYVAILGFILLPIIPHTGGRLYSILGEPSGFCIILIPALYYYADLWQRERRYGWRFLVILVAFVLTLSSGGFMGIFFGLYLFGTRYRFGAFFMPAAVLLAALLTYSQSAMFQMRFDDTISSLAKTDVSGTNLSTFALVSNVFVTEKAFLAHPVLGGGIGSYELAHERYISGLFGISAFAAMGMSDQNANDGSSLLLRVTEEFGITGLIAMAWFLLRFWPRKSTPQRRAIAMALLCYFFLKLLRSGPYLSPEEWLFITTYAVNGILARRELLSRPHDAQHIYALARVANNVQSAGAGGHL